jgi:Mg2+/Co2+ transporter CorB
MTTTIIITAGIIVALLVLSAFFSGAETAMTATSKARMHEMEKRGNRRARAVRYLIDMPERMIGAILLGNNLVNILASALATSLFMSLFGSSGVIYATLVMTALVLIFGEVMPKTYAIVNPDRYALFVAPIIKLLVAAFAPVVMAVEFIVKKVMGLFGVDISKANNILNPREELRGTIDLHHKEGAFVKHDRDMLGGILTLDELELSDVMVHRTKMHSIDLSMSASEVIDDVLKSGFSRVPVWREDPDNIVGVVHAKNLLAALQAHKGDVSKVEILDACRDPWFVPDTTPTINQLNAFLQRKSHFAIVVDEYGEVMGLVTLEDILEEIVGEIGDETDVDEIEISRESSGSYVVNGETPIRDLNRLHDWDLPDDEATTLAGLVIHEAQIIPDVGQVFTFHGFRFEVVARNRNKIMSIRVTKVTA